MKIGINALFLGAPASGSGQYLSHLLNALAEIDQHNEYVLLTPQSVPVFKTADGNNAGNFSSHMQAVPAFARHNENIEKVVWEQLTGPAAARNAHVDIFHVPHFASPLLPSTPTIVTIHDVIPLRLPLYRAGLKMQLYTRLVARAAHKADLIITVSQHAKQDIIDTLQLPPERIRVIYEAAGDELRPVTDPTLLTAVRARYGLGERYIFYLGGLDQRKNVPQLVRAFAALLRRLDDADIQLFISGNPDKHSGPLFPDPRLVAAELGIADRVICRFVEEEDKAAIYSGASLFVYPSLYEGFGLNPLEAMSCGVPVICSNRTSLPEVVGDAAISFDPDDTEALVEAMQRVLTDQGLAADLRARSLRRADQFSWRKAAAETLAVYEEVCARRKK